MQNWGFWAVSFALVLGVTVLLLQALRKGQAAGDDDAALKVYRDQLAEVDRDLARGVLAPSEAERLKTEVSRRLLDADRARLSSGKVPPAAGGAVAGIAIVVLMSAAVAGYYWLGAPNYPDLPLKTRLAMAEDTYRNRPTQAAAEAAAPAPAPAQADAEFLDLMQKLRAAVAARPDDMQGLQLLASNEATLGNYTASRQAFDHLVALKGDQATVADHIGLAQTMIVASGGYVSPEAEQQLIQTLQLDPTNPLARYYTGLMFAQTGRPDRTFAFWEPLLREGPATAPWIAPIRSALPDVADMAGIKYSLPASATDKGPSAADVAAADSMTTEDRQAMIAGMVDQLQTRLTTQGGSPEEWAKLINALAVTGNVAAAKAAQSAANTAYAGNDAALAAIAAAANSAGLVP